MRGLRGAELTEVAITSVASRASAMSKVGMVVISFILKIKAKIVELGEGGVLLSAVFGARLSLKLAAGCCERF